ncbi:MAG: glycosyltransferase family 39 protein [Halioglobus sp.]|nr:glycosyltransferase family 39 protein [Halioglobus sp.]
MINYRHQPTRCAIGILIILLLTMTIRMIHSNYIIGSDGLGYYAHVRSILIDEDMHYANEFLDFNPFGHAVPDPYQVTATGHVPNPYSVGPALLWVPFFLLAHALTLIAGSLGLNLAPDGYSILYQLFIGFGSVSYGIAGLALIYRILVRFFETQEALIATLLVTLATNVVYYLAVEPVMSHAMSMFAVTLFAFLWMKSIGQRTKGELLLLAFVGGLMIMVRPQNALFLSLLGLEWLGLFKTNRSYLDHWRKHITDGCIFSVFLLVALLPQLVAWKILYGQFLVDSYDGASFDFARPVILDSLFSSRHGLISWTPIVFLALMGMVLYFRKNVRLSIALLVAFFLQVYINASWVDYWWFGVSFGSRPYMNCSFIFAFGLAYLLSITRNIKLLTYPLFTTLVLWNLLFVIQFTLNMVPQSEAVDFGEVLSNHFEIPNMVLQYF